MCVIQKDTLMCYIGVCREGQICVCYTERHFNVLHRSLQRRAGLCVTQEFAEKSRFVCYTGVCREEQVCVLHRSSQRRAGLCVTQEFAEKSRFVYRKKNSLLE